MKKCLGFLFFMALSFTSNAQSDILSVRNKKGKPVNQFTTGLPITYTDNAGKIYSGNIIRLKADTMTIRCYDITYYTTNIGIRISDTTATNYHTTHYKDIQAIRVYDRERPIRGKVDKILMFGGGGYLVLNTVNSIGKGDFTSTRNVRNLAIAAGAFTGGLIINRFFGVNNFSRKGYEIVYIRTS